jgi:histone acetyltransferase (RNA polymerase elongator complex component)
VFCNQRRITAHSEASTLEEIHKIVDRNLTTIHAKNHAKEDIHTEIAFFGGSFTAIDVAEQEQYLGIAKELKAVGKIDGIRISTRPDCIDDVVIARLKSYDVDLVELGAQSFDDDVLIASNRGHSTSDVACAMKRLKAAGFQTGLQLMVGLPGDTKAKSIESARRAAALSPDVARIYPVVVLKDTALADQMCDGRYIPWAELEMVDTVKEMYKILTESGANVIRVGLKSTDNIRNDSESVLSDYHPAFFELVLSEIALETMIRVFDAQNRDE